MPAEHFRPDASNIRCRISSTIPAASHGTRGTGGGAIGAAADGNEDTDTEEDEEEDEEEGEEEGGQADEDAEAVDVEEEPPYVSVNVPSLH